MNEEQLQELLSVYRHRPAMPTLSRRSPSGRWWLATAAAVLIALLLAAWPFTRPGSWIVTQGLHWRVLQAGETISTAATGTRIRSRGIGFVDIGADTVVRIGDGYRIALDHGSIHATTTSPPGIFIVDTPHATAIDLGCEYDLAISPDGAGVLRVSAGWVQLQHDGHQTLVPAGARAVIASGGRIAPPVFEDAPVSFQAAVRRGDLNTMLRLARRRDAFTLLNLFRDATPEERLRIYDRLNALVPAPASVPRDAMRSWTIGSTDAWWPDVVKATGVPAIKKKKGMLRGL